MELDYAVPTLGIRSERARFSIDSFFHIEGGFHFRKIGNKRVTVATGVNLFTGIQLAPTMAELQLKSDANVSADYTTISNLEVDAVDFVLTNANAFVGYGNPDFSKSLKDQDIYGLSLSDVDLAFTMMSLTYGLSSFPEFYALKGSAAGIELHTGSDFFELSTGRIEFGFNRGDNWNGTEFEPVVDFTTSKDFQDPTGAAHGLKLEVGGETVNIDHGGAPYMGVAVSDALLKIGGFIYVSGNLAIQKADAGFFNIKSLVANYNNVGMDGLTFGMSDANLFLGLNGPYFGTGDEKGAIGLYARNVDIGLGMFTPNDGNDIAITKLGLEFYALKATVEEVGIAGLSDVLDLKIKGLEVEVNLGSSDIDGVDPWIDFKESMPAKDGNPAGYALKTSANTETGGDPIYIDYEDAHILGRVRNATFKISDFLYVSGGFAIGYKQAERLKVNLGALAANIGVTERLETEIEMLTIGANDLTGFFGIDGPHRIDENKDGILTPDEKLNEDAVGLLLEDIDFGFMIGQSAVLKLLKLDKFSPKFVATKLNVGQATFLGIGDYFKVDIRDVEVGANFSFIDKGAPYSLMAIPFLPSIDFKASSDQGYYEIPTGSDENNVKLDYDATMLEARIGFLHGAIVGLEFAASAALKIDMDANFVSEPGLFNGKRNEINGMGLELAIQDAYGFRGIVLENGLPSLTARYWRDTNNDGLIGEGDTAHPGGIGFAVEDFDLGIVYVKDYLTSATHLAARADMTSAAMVGVPGVTAEFTEFEFGLNIAIGAALNPDPTSIAMAAAKRTLVPIISPMINQIIVEVNKLSGSFADNTGAAAKGLNDVAFNAAVDANGAIQDKANELKVSAAAQIAEHQ
ncbi:hypothetical protein HOF92_05580, partial [bacterium]|nr:hypothetical protein [bacterium]